jgi:hypothetical protein
MKNFLICILLTHSYAFSSDTVVCPSEYSTENLITKTPNGWEGLAYAPGPRMVLRYAGVLVGDPKVSAQGIQIPQPSLKVKGGFKLKFPYLDKFTEPLEKWVYCAYGIGGDVQLLKKVSDNTKTCEAVFKGNENTVSGITVICN